jgi:phosphohistidine phosphatase
MIIYFVRHAKAKKRNILSFSAHDDQSRPLVKSGVSDFKNVLNRFQHKLVNPTILLSSPYLRAIQTAQILSKRLKLGIVEVDNIFPDSDPQNFLNWLEQSAVKENLIVVGHEPNLSKIISLLMGSSDQKIIKLKKSSITAIEISDLSFGLTRNNLLLWSVNPQLVS